MASCDSAVRRAPGSSAPAGFWYNTPMKKDLGCLAFHRAYLGKPPKKGGTEPFPCRPADVFAKQVAGLAARLRFLRCRDVVVGLSGGLDSTLALLVCVAAFDRLGLDRRGIHAITMPGFGTSRRTRGNAGRLADGLGVPLETISIAAACRRHLRDIGHDGHTPDVTFENAQARMRNMSEIALGWCTFNGDHMSMFGVNSGVPKTIVRRVCEWWAGMEERKKGEGRGKKEKGNAVMGNGMLVAAAIRDIVATPVSPELVKGQVTEDKIGPYELHDFFLWNFIVNEMGSKDLLKAAARHFGDAYPAETVARTLKTFMHRFFTQAFKRNCAPDGVRVFGFDLSPRGWWVPSDIGIVRV